MEIQTFIGFKFKKFHKTIPSTICLVGLKEQVPFFIFILHLLQKTTQIT